MLGDVIITVSLAVSLYRARTGWASTDRTLRRMIVLLAETQLTPTILAIAFLLVFIIKPSSTFDALFLCVPKVYTVALFIVLNSRRGFLNDFAPVRHDVSLTTFGVRSRQTNANVTGGIRITTETYTESHKITMPPTKKSVNRLAEPADGAVHDLVGADDAAAKIHRIPFAASVILS
ncbi:hypothetical protein Q5752_005862 [Cryptotrichosporon argae]